MRVESRQKWLSVVVAALAACGLAPSLSAAIVIPVPNGSFESQAVSDGSFTPSPITDWTVTAQTGGAGAGVVNPVNAAFPGTTGGNLPAPGDGVNYAFMNLSGTGDTATLTNASSLDTIPSQGSYTLTVAMGRRVDYPTFTGSLTFGLSANGIVIPSTLVTVTPSTAVAVAGTFQDFSTTYTPTLSQLGQSLRIVLIGNNTDGQFDQPVFDNLRLTYVIPEPGTAFLLTGAALLWRGRVARRNAT